MFISAPPPPAVRAMFPSTLVVAGDDDRRRGIRPSTRPSQRRPYLTPSPPSPRLPPATTSPRPITSTSPLTAPPRRSPLRRPAPGPAPHPRVPRFQGRIPRRRGAARGNDPPASLWHWHLIDVFVYFSHYLVTLPPCWINAGHLHGVKVPPSTRILDLRSYCFGRLHRFLNPLNRTCLLRFASVSEGFGNVHRRVGKGAEICKEMLATEASAKMYAGKLAELLTCGLMDGWYDAITVDGDLVWQNKLNEMNKHS
ncbi:hypothetical protein GUJ93_ZPchr0010g9281 [Zizania palustris]|uniref:Cytosolic endo-beta-N-acetylglucosaminidase TIM barrel domain-containing protein n=1 Tax=Zizania palustris TaxID=103762 RepID=A0A8J5W9B6_ZIZPA|nr:hypothetical protein GUJ93_ZPchr0010g9281 [Zizania palustris]